MIFEYIKLHQKIKEDSEDYIINNIENLLFSSVILAGLKVEPMFISNFLNKVIKQKCIVSDELRFTINILIKKYVSENDMPELSDFGSIPKKENLANPYLSNRECFSSSIEYPIMKYELHK